MPWRETFLRRFGPGFLGGVTLGDWLRLLRENRFRVPPSCFMRAAAITFPDAKFVHIRRNPFAVFPSTRKMLMANFATHCLQRPALDELDDWVLRQYRTMYEVHFEERGLIPDGRFCEVAFEDLEREPLEQTRRIYEALDLPDFGRVEPALRERLRSIEGYQKNKFPELPAELRKRIAREWGFCFERWGYDRKT